MLYVAQVALLAFVPSGGYESSGTSTCSMRPLGWMSTCLSGPFPEFTNLWGTFAGATTIWPLEAFGYFPNSFERGFLRSSASHVE